MYHGYDCILFNKAYCCILCLTLYIQCYRKEIKLFVILVLPWIGHHFPGLGLEKSISFRFLRSLKRISVQQPLRHTPIQNSREYSLPGYTLQKLLSPKNPANYSLRRNQDFALPLYLCVRRAWSSGRALDL